LTDSSEPVGFQHLYDHSAHCELRDAKFFGEYGLVEQDSAAPVRLPEQEGMKCIMIYGMTGWHVSPF